MKVNTKGKRILITGGAGFIGTVLTERLISDNRVVIYDNFHRNAIKSTKLMSHSNLHIIEGDVLDINGVKKAMEGCSVVVHLAAIAGVDTVMSMPAKTMEVALIGTYNVLQAAIEGNIERFVDFSTSEVFGSYAFKVTEEDATALGAIGEARWTYAVSKLATEHLAHNYHKQYGLPTVSIRPFNIYGPKQVGVGAIHQFVVRAINNKDLEIHNDGGQIRSWCYVDDIIDGILLCLEKKEAIGNAFNIGNPRSTLTVYNLAREIARLANSDSRIVFVKREMQDVELRIPDIEKAKRIIGFKPKIDLETGLLRTIEWYRKNKK